MNLLLDSSWGDFPTWGLFILGIITAFFAGFSLFQQKEIKGIVEIAEKLKVQNEILIKRFEIERITSQRVRMPYFVYNRQDDEGSERFYLRLTNIGLEATNISFRDRVDNPKYFLSPPEKSSATTDEFLTVVINYHNNIFENIDFDLVYKGHDGKERYQRVHKFLGSNISIDPPQDDILLN